MRGLALAGVSFGVFVGVQGTLKGAIVTHQPPLSLLQRICWARVVGIGLGIKPVVGVELLQGPAHDVEALLQHLPAG